MYKIYAHTYTYIEIFMKSGEKSSFYSKWHSLLPAILYIKWTMESYFPKQPEMLYFWGGSYISKPEIFMKDICTVPSGQVFN